MVRAFIEAMLGPIGVQVLRFYEANSLSINLIVVSYGLVMVLSWTNLVNIRKRLISAMVAQMRGNPRLTSGSAVKRVLREVEIPWETVGRQMWFPLVARQMALWPKRITAETLQALLPAEELAAQALEALAREKGEAPSERPSVEE